MTHIDVLIDDDRWTNAGLEHLVQSACVGVFDALSLNDGFEISVLGCDDARITALNGDFRSKPSSTNVLSWPSEERAAESDGGTPPAPDATNPELGDIALAYETCVTEANEQAKEFSDHVTHLLVHAILHLLGYDHQTEQDAALMETWETRILAKMGIADPYS